MHLPSVSVVMVSYHTGDVLWESIGSVLAQPELEQLLVVDNGNPQEVREALVELSQKEPKLKVLTIENKGFANGCNSGASQAEGEYLLILNPDCIVPPHSFNKVIEALKQHPESYIAGGYLANLDGSEQNGSRRNLLTPGVALVESLGLHRFFPHLARMNIQDSPVPLTPVLVPAISGAFMMMKREQYRQLGGMDEGYFFHVEDLDFCLQVQRQGGKILYVPGVKILHYRSTSDVSSAFVEYNKTKGFIRYFTKNFSGQYAPGVMPLLIAAIYARMVLKLLQGYIKSVRRKVL